LGLSTTILPFAVKVLKISKQGNPMTVRETKILNSDDDGPYYNYLILII